MTLSGKVFARIAFIGLLTVVNAAFAQTAAPPTVEATTAPATRPTASIMSIVPADAWGVVGLTNLEQLDTEVMRLGQKLGLPIFFAPSGLIQMGLGITQGFDPAGGMALIVLDGAKYPGAANWAMAQGFPLPVVLAMAASDPAALIQSLNGKATDDPKISSVTLQQESVFAATKGGYVLIGPDVDILKGLTATGAAATQRASEVLKPAFVQYASQSKIFVYINVKPVLGTYGPVIKGLLAFAAAAAQGAQGQAGAGNMSVPAMTMMGSSYIDVLSKQVDKLLVFADLEPNGLHLSAVATFQPDTLLGKVFAATKPSGKPLLAGLPDGAFILAGAQEQTGQEYVQDLVDLFSKPYMDAMRASGSEAMVAQAEQQAKVAQVRVQLAKLQQTGKVGVYQLPKGEHGSLGILAEGQFSDTAKAYELIKQNVKSQVDFMAAQQPKVKQFLDAVTYTAEVETVDGAKVDTLLLDLTKLSKVADAPQDEMQKIFRIVKTLLGSDGVKVRIAVTPKHILATLGGGDAFLQDALAMAKAGKPALATQPAIVKITDRLPKNCVSVLYVSAENLLQVVDRVGKAVSDKGLPFAVGQTSAPIAAALVSDPLGMHVTLYVPTDLAVSVKGMYTQAGMQHRQGRSRAPGSQPAEGAESEPKPEF
jgi:hypothetical protein